jgi:hypothetical protein
MFMFQVHRSEAAVVRPSQEFWSWLIMGSQEWQLRGGLSMNPTELYNLLGSELSDAIADGSIEMQVCNALNFSLSNAP